MSPVFISYSHHDRKAARQLAQDLRARNIAVWLDLDSISAGANWSNAIQNALAAASTLVVLLSPDSVESDSVRDEMEFGLRQKKPVLLLMVRDTRLPIQMRNRQYIDARQDWDRAVNQLVDVLSALRPPPPLESDVRRETGPMQRVPPPAAEPAPAPQETTVTRRPWGWRMLFGLGLVALALALAMLVSALLLRDDGEKDRQLQSGSVATNSQTSAALAVTRTPLPTATPTLTPDGRFTLTAVASEFRATQAHNLTQVAEVAPNTPVAVAVAGDERALDAVIEERVNARVQVALVGTVAALRATDEGGLSIAEAGEIAAMIADATADQQDIDVRLLLVFNLGLLALALVGGAAVLATRGSRPFWRTTGHSTRAHPPSVPAPLPEDYQIFISSSDADKAWVGRLVRDLTDMDHQVWWYAKDAPGLPFGQEIVRAIFYTKVFLVVVSPDSMASKHVEEEIRLADRYDRPIITVIHRPTDARLYGLAKSSDIDFSSEHDYKSAMEFLTQAINRLLERHRQAVHDEAEADDGAAPDAATGEETAQP